MKVSKANGKTSKPSSKVNGKMSSKETATMSDHTIVMREPLGYSPGWLPGGSNPQIDFPNIMFT